MLPTTATTVTAAPASVCETGRYRVAEQSFVKTSRAFHIHP